MMLTESEPEMKTEARTEMKMKTEIRTEAGIAIAAADENG
jgi:hypothetical protein